jgi:3-deoxy-D-manno-octulosonic-acid transferase
MLFLYSILFIFFWPLVFIGFVWRYGLRRTLKGLPERFGWTGDWPAPGALWVHAASVGEVRAAEPFLRAVPGRFPGIPRLLTTTTLNGKELAIRLGVAETVRLAPIDRPGTVRRVLKRVRPRAVVLIETELWPHWLRAFAAARAPVVVVNGRVSDGAFPVYLRLRRLWKPLLSPLARVGAQSAVNASRFLQLGASPSAVVVTGNIKNDVALPDPARRAELRRAFGAGEDPVWVAGSTHGGEEAIVALAYGDLRRAFPSLRLVAAPRHVERAGEVARLFAEAGNRTLLRSQLSAGKGWDVLVVDTVGELAEIYGLADVAFVGGSLIPRGGQNPLEPARWGVPVLHGPHMNNFREMAQVFKEKSAAIEVADGGALEDAVRELLSSPERRAALGKAARAAADGQRGALEASLALLDEALEKVSFK